MTIDFCAAIIALSLALSSCAPAQKSADISLSADAHAELNFGYYGDERIIKDFAIDNGYVYILQRDGTVLKYDNSGNFEEKYDLNLDDQGLTAFRLTCKNGKMYLLDGHNNAIITAENGDVKNVSTLSFSDVGLVKNFYATTNNTLIMSFADIEEAYTAEIDLSKAAAEIIGEKRKGYLIDENVTYLPKVSDSENNAKQVDITVYESGNVTNTFSISPAESDRSIIGLSIYGVSGGNCFGLLHEFVNPTGAPEDEQYIQTSVNINANDGTIQTSESCLDGDEIIKLSSGGTYCMKISDSSLTIKPIGEYFSDWQPGDAYVIKK